jgi:hypothetical protein
MRSLRCVSSLCLLVLLTAGALGGCADDADDACRSHAEKVQLCNRVLKPSVCDTEEGRCGVACYARLKCSEYFAVDEDRPPAWLTQCLTPCSERFECKNGESVLMRWQCDGSEDCSDGSDEVGCKYFVCKDGQRVRETAQCNEEAECRDGSDEAVCS